MRAAELVDRTASPAGDVVTQFELLTAAALCEFAAAGVDVAVLEAGLGGRYDATNVVDSRVAVLTNVGLEHTRYLGPTVADIAREKLDVVRPGATLVVGADLDGDAFALARATVDERGATLVEAEALLDFELRSGGGYQRRNFATACCAARAFLGRELDHERVAAVAASLVVRGRFEVLDGRPVTLLDGAHNDGGVEALAESLPAFAAGRRLVAVVSILDDKDAGGMLARLLDTATLWSARPAALRARCLPRRLPRSPDSSAGRRRSCWDRTGRSSARASWPATTAWCWPPDRSI